MRVLYVHPFAQEVSGPDESLLVLLKSLKGAVDPVVVLPPDNPHVARYKNVGATVVEQPMQRIRRTTRPADIARYAGLFAPEVLRFRKLIRRHEVDLVHTNMEVVLQSGLAARLAGVGSIYHVRGTSFATPRAVCNAVVAAINSFADEIIVISRAVGEIFYERGVQGKVSVVYNSLDPAAFDNMNAEAIVKLRRELTGGAIDAPLVATVGRINPRKGLECFIKTAAIVARAHPQARFAVVGDAAHASEQKYFAQLQGLAEEFGLAKRLVFAPAQRNIAELMSAVDILTMTTVNEGFGRVAIEAMAARRPVVASRVGGLPEVVEDGVTGHLVGVEQPEEFASRIVRLLDSPQTLRQMGTKGRERVERLFSNESNVPKILEVYRRVLRARGRGTFLPR